MALKFALYENPLAEDDDNYIARTQQVDTVDLDFLIEQMTLPGALTEAHARAVLTEYQNCVKHLLGLGFAINDGMIRYRLNITGVFDSDEDSFDAKRHKVVLNVRANKTMKNSFTNVGLLKVSPTYNKTSVSSFMDLSSNVYDSTFTPGQMARIRGVDMLFDVNDPKQGVFFIDTENREYRVEKYGIVNPSSVIFIVPDCIEVGEYQLILCSRKNKDAVVHKAYLSARLTRV